MLRSFIWTVCALLVALPVDAQLSTDFPGVPRGRVPFLSTGQGRFELDVSGYRLQGEGTDTIAGSLRMGFGKTWRIGTSLELGYDLSLGEVRVSHLNSTSGGADAPVDIDATAVYGIRMGAKYQVFNALDPDGYGISASLGAAIQPELKPAFVYSRRDSVDQTGGYLGDKPEDGGLDARLTAATIWVAAASYRQDRLDVDGALIYERASDGDTAPLVENYDGVSLALGGRYRLTSSFGLGISYWGSGAPPWRDRLRLGLREKDDPSFGILLSFGSQLEKGTDVMISSPTGEFSESLSLYVRVH